VDRLSY